jgi:putative toxin-antitoxin system antitoxin component (TIGR02293 family)
MESRVLSQSWILDLAVDVFGDLEVARTWLEHPNRVLKGSAPLELLDTDAGVEQVTQVLNRIEYGVYS